MHEDFMNRANILRNEYLLKAEKLFVAQKNGWLAAFIEHFQKVCTKIVTLQNENSLSVISYLEYNMLYSNFINRQYTAEVWVYGERQYLDKEQHMIGEYNASFLFGYFDELWDKLLSERKRYVGTVKSREITSFMIEALPSFYSYLASIARLAIVELVCKSPFADIIKNDRFRVNVGEYMAKTEPVFTENKNKNACKLAKWFDDQLDNEYIFGDYSGLDFSGKIYDYIDFRYARFQDSVLNNTILVGSTLIGANFRNSAIENGRLDYCAIYEADFSYANLKNASLIGVTAKAGLPDDTKWKYVGFLPVSFRDADLTGANFTGANLTGADFTGAILADVDFTDAVLDGAIFSSSIEIKN